MAGTSGDRSKYFPAIEAKHGGPISIWIDRLRDLGDARYPEQIAFLRENHGFSQAHANALVMYVRDSPTSKRFTTVAECLAAMDPVPAATAKAIFAAIRKTHPKLEAVVAWNHPMLRNEDGYVIGLSASKQGVLVNPFSGAVLDQLGDRLAGYVVNKKTFRVPLDWKIDADLLRALVDARLAELAADA